MAYERQFYFDYNLQLLSSSLMPRNKILWNEAGIHHVQDSELGRSERHALLVLHRAPAGLTRRYDAI